MDNSNLDAEKARVELRYFWLHGEETAGLLACRHPA